MSSIARFDDFFYSTERGGYSALRWGVLFDNFTFQNEIRFAGWNQTTIFFYDKENVHAISLATREKQSYSLPKTFSVLYFCEEGGYAGFESGEVGFFPKCNSHVTTFQAHSGWVTALTVQGDALFTAGEDEKLRVWDRKTLTLLREITTKGPAIGIQVYDQKIVTIEEPFHSYGGGTVVIRDYKRPPLKLIKVVEEIIRQTFRDLIGFFH